MQTDHILFMRQCLRLAGNAKRNGKTGVGSIIVKDNKIISEGEEGAPELPRPLAHAELLAIAQASRLLGTTDLSDCILYTTVEPCVMCSYVIRNMRIGHVVIGTPTTGLGGVSSKYPILIADDIAAWGKPPAVVLNILEDECRKAI